MFGVGADRVEEARVDTELLVEPKLLVGRLAEERSPLEVPEEITERRARLGRRRPAHVVVDAAGDLAQGRGARGEAPQGAGHPRGVAGGAAVG